MFNFDHILTPLAIVRATRHVAGGYVMSRSVYIFGIRIIYWTCN